MTAYWNVLGDRFFFNRQTLMRIVEVFEPDDWAKRPVAAGGNDAHWILGHLVLSRRYLLRKLGEELPKDPWEEGFNMGAKPAGTEGYPPPGALLEDFHALGKRLSERLGAMTPEEAREPWGSSFPDGSDTLAGGALFLHFHETYHLGQLGLIRRLLGKPGFV